MDEKEIARIAAETGMDPAVLRKYVEKLIEEEGMGKGAVKKRVRSVGKKNISGDVYYEMQKINYEPVSKYVGDDVYFPFIPETEGDGGVDIGSGIKLQDANGNFIHPDIANSDEDIERLRNEGMDEKTYNKLFARVLKDKITGSKRIYDNFIKKNNIGQGRNFDQLDDYTKLLMADTNYNAGLGIFRKMMTGIANNDMDQIGKEYHVKKNIKGKFIPIGSRNEMRKSFLLKNMAMNQNMVGTVLENYMDNVTTGQGIMSKIGRMYDQSSVGKYFSGQMQPAMPDSTSMSPQEYESYFLENTNVDNPYGPK